MATNGFAVITRSDGKYGWHLMASNGAIIATDGGQGYENWDDANSMGRRVLSGEFKVA